MNGGRLRAALGVGMLLVLSGCGLTGAQREATARFARATAGLGEYTAKEFAGLRGMTIEMNTYDIAIGGTANPNDLDESLNPDRIAARVAAATALSSYGQLLLSLVEETQEAELKAASDNFVSSFRNVSGKRLSDTQLDALGTLVQEVGGLLVERKKAIAVRRIVKDAKPDVDTVCDLLIQDFRRTGLAVAQGVDVTLKRLKGDAIVALATQGVDYRSRLVAAEAYRLSGDADGRLNVLGAQAAKTLTTLKAANAQLAAAMEDDRVSISDIRALGAQIKELADATRALTGK
jgi:hypothetical protein